MIVGLRWLLAFVAALALAFLVFVSTSWNLGQSTGLGGSRAPFPEDPSITLGAAMGDFLRSRGEDVERLIPIADEAAKYDPIDGRIFLFHAFGELQAHPQAPPVALLETARHYDPRLGEVRVLLLEVYGKGGRPAEALAEADTMSAMSLAEQGLIVELMSEFVLRGEVTDQLAAALAKSGLRGKIMVRLANRRADAAMLEKLAGPMRGIAKNEIDRRWIGPFASSVARANGFESARRIWANLHDVDQAAVGRQVFDPDFAALAATPPFGWNIGRSDAGVAEINEGALEIYYYGRQPGALAEQLLLLEPGSYSLTIAERAPEANPPAGLVWQISCAERGGRPDPVPVARMIAASGGPLRFVVPPDGCPAQYIQLIGVPSDIVRSQSATIESVRIARTGA